MTAPSSDYQTWLATLTLGQVSALLREQGCEEGFVKSLAANNNSKQQIYLASDLVQVSRLPSGDPIASSGSSDKPGAKDKKKFQCAVEFHWMTPNGPRRAPNAKLIYYPQYPEVRFSGFLAGCDDPPSFLLNRELRGAEVGRTLILAPNQNDEVFGFVLPPESIAAKQLWNMKLDQYGVMSVWNFAEDVHEALPSIFEELCRINRLGFVDSQRLKKVGPPVPYSAQNGGGYTLEALLGIRPNAKCEPDYQGWEVKQHGVKNLERSSSGPITMFTPEPDGGLYNSKGVEFFLRKYGYKRSGDDNRYDFAGIHKCPNGWNGRSKLRIRVEGYSVGGVEDPDGMIILEGKNGVIAASWSFEKLLGRWKRKHEQAVFIPSLAKKGKTSQYQFGSTVITGTGTSFPQFLDAVINGTVYYDPGLNLKRKPDGTWQSKKRSQFRTKLRDISVLYDTVSVVDSCHPVLPSAVGYRDFDH